MQFPASASPNDGENKLIFCLGLGTTARGLYVQIADGSYERVSLISDDKNITVSNTAPISPTVGDIWVDTN